MKEFCARKNSIGALELLLGCYKESTKAFSFSHQEAKLIFSLYSFLALLSNPSLTLASASLFFPPLLLHPSFCSFSSYWILVVVHHTWECSAYISYYHYWPLLVFVQLSECIGWYTIGKNISESRRRCKTCIYYPSYCPSLEDSTYWLSLSSRHIWPSY